eukprot:ANDGO_03150.mRNA.1 Endoplasmic reticulum vesicle protein 25
MVRLEVALVCVGLLAVLSSAFEFDLQGGTSLCFMEELTGKSPMIGEISVLPAPYQQIDIEVIGPQQNIVFVEKNVEKHALFRHVADDNGGDYKICFHNKLPPGTAYTSTMVRRIEFELRSGVNAVDYDQIATKEHLKPVEVQLRHMEDVVKELYSELHNQVDREQHMRNTNEATYGRVSWLGFLTLITLVGMGIGQSIYLKKYLSKKKII